MLASKGIQCAKIWVFTPALYSTSDSKLISFVDEKNLSPTGTIDWRYHVAPVIQVQIGDNVRKMVIDLSLFPNDFVRYRTWLAKLKTKRLIYLIMDSEWYLYNSSIITNAQLQFDSNELSESNKPNIELPHWFSDKCITDFFKYEEDALEQHWVEKGLAVNETALIFYENEIKPILRSKQHKDLVTDYKMLVGDVFNFETIFRDGNWNYEMNTDFQLKHQDIITKYREIYVSNLNKWQESMAFLTDSINKS